jgi:hypothetical protein
MGKKSKSKSKYTYHYIPPVPSFFHHSIFSLEIKDSTIHNAGLGVYTLDAIPNGTCIDYYVGVKCRYPMSSYFIETGETCGIDAGSYPRCYMAMLNDIFNSTYTVNCEFRIKDNIVSVYAIRDILPHEELFVSYGDEYW